MPNLISQAAVDLIVSCEVSSRKTYEKQYRHPEWPGGASGVTIAIGYDLGYASQAKERADWTGRCLDGELAAMERCLGVHGDPARALLPQVRDGIDIGWDDAMAVFLGRDVPQWTKAVCDAIPGASKLSPDCLGALVSLAYNRGASFNTSGERYREMRDIRSHIISDNLAAVPRDIRAMKRFWPNVHGLLARRDAEAALFEQGLKAPSVAPGSHVAPEAPKPLPPKPAGAAEHGTAAGTAAAAGKAAQASVPPEHIWSVMEIALAIGGVIAVAVLAWIIIRQFRKAQPVVAREKDIPPSDLQPVPEAIP